MPAEVPAAAGWWSRRRAMLRDWAESFIVALGLAILIKGLVFEIYKIPTSSMEPTLIGKLQGGDRIIVNKVKYRFRPPHRWDIFVFRSPEKGVRKNLIKRVTGLPGERLVVLGGDIYLNDRSLPEEKPPAIRDQLFQTIERLDFTGDDWQGRLTAEGLTARAAGGVLRIACPEKGRLEYRRPVTNFYLRRGALAVKPHAAGSVLYPVPEADTLNSLIPCPQPGCTHTIDLVEMALDPARCGRLKQQNSLNPRIFDDFRSGQALVGDMRITCDLAVTACAGSVGCTIREGGDEYLFALYSAAAGKPSMCIVRDTATGDVRDARRILFTLPVPFRGRLAFMNCDNRLTLAVNDQAVFTEVLDPGRPAGPPAAGPCGWALHFKAFTGAIDNLAVDRDIYYTNIYDLVPDYERMRQQGLAMRIPLFAMEPDKPVVLGPDEYFGMGDNSSNSNDARFFGPIPGANVLGNAVMVFPWFETLIPPRFTTRWKLAE
ncbi:MAG: signal peptidase I [Planctomycetota bacterium]